MITLFLPSTFFMLYLPLARTSSFQSSRNDAAGENLPKISCGDLEQGWSAILYSHCVLFKQT